MIIWGLSDREWINSLELHRCVHWEWLPSSLPHSEANILSGLFNSLWAWSIPWRSTLQCMFAQTLTHNQMFYFGSLSFHQNTLKGKVIDSTKLIQLGTNDLQSTVPSPWAGSTVCNIEFINWVTSASDWLSLKVDIFFLFLHNQLWIKVGNMSCLLQINFCIKP